METYFSVVRLEHTISKLLFFQVVMSYTTFEGSMQEDVQMLIGFTLSK